MRTSTYMRRLTTRRVRYSFPKLASVHRRPERPPSLRDYEPDFDGPVTRKGTTWQGRE